MVDTPKKPGQAPSQAEKMATSKNPATRARGYTDMIASKDLETRARGYQDRDAAASGSPTTLAQTYEVITAKFATNMEKSLYGLLGNYGEIFRQSKRYDDPKQARRELVAARIGARLDRGGTIGELLANKIRGAAYRGGTGLDPEQEYQRIAGNFGAVGAELQVIERRFQAIESKVDNVKTQFYNFREKMYDTFDLQKQGFEKLEKEQKKIFKVLTNDMKAAKGKLDAQEEAYNVEVKPHDQLENSKNNWLSVGAKGTKKIAGKVLDFIKKHPLVHSLFALPIMLSLIHQHKKELRKAMGLEDVKLSSERNKSSKRDDSIGITKEERKAEKKVYKRLPSKNEIFSHLGIKKGEGKLSGQYIIHGDKTYHIRGFSIDSKGVVTYKQPDGIPSQPPKKPGLFGSILGGVKELWGAKSANASSISTPGLKGHGTPSKKIPGMRTPQSGISLSRASVEASTSKFLQYGALPDGFGFLPGHMGRLGSAQAIAASGAMPLMGSGIGIDSRAGGVVSSAMGYGRGALGYHSGGASTGHVVPMEYTKSQGGTVDVGEQSTEGSWRRQVHVPYYQNGKGMSASVRYNNPGASYTRKRDELFGVQGYGVIGGGHKIGKYPTIVHGLASNMDLVSKEYVGMTLSAATAKWRGRGGTPLPKGLGLGPNDKITEEHVNDEAFMGRMFSEFAKHESGRKNSPITSEQYQQAFKMYKSGGIEGFKKDYPNFKPTEITKRENTAKVDPVQVIKNLSEGKHVSDKIVETAVSQLGLHEDKDTSTIIKFLKGGGAAVNPSDTPWCASFVNAVLERSGSKGTRSATAGSFAKWGSGINSAKEVKKGDVVITWKRSPRTGLMGSHVEIASGDSYKSEDGKWKVDTVTANTEDNISKRTLAFNKKFGTNYRVRRSREAIASMRGENEDDMADIEPASVYNQERNRMIEKWNSQGMDWKTEEGRNVDDMEEGRAAIESDPEYAQQFTDESRDIDDMEFKKEYKTTTSDRKEKTEQDGGRNSRYHPENRAPSPGSGGYGSYMRCFV